MNIKKLIALLTLILFLSIQADAMRYEWRDKDDSKQSANKAAACSPATELVLMQYNNVRALIETGGSMWQDRSTSRAFYRIPAEGNVSVIYAGALWLGGYSPDQQLKLAAVTFRADGNDFWPGPLTIDGAAEIEPDVCEQYDRFFVTERQWSEQHRAWFDCQNDPLCNSLVEFPNGYVVPSEFYEYPAHGNTSLSQDYYLAPFYDYDLDGNYDPDAGDYPWYDLTGDVDCANKSREDTIPLFGDQNYWWVFNDKGNIHTETNGESIGMEIRAQAFAFATNDEINNMTFYNYVMINRGTTSLNDTYFGQWVDADLGNPQDDYVGCDVTRGLGYCYNGDNFDEGTDASTGYGDNPPAVGVDFFEGPYQDYDGIDNPGPETTNNPLSAEEAFAGNGIPYKGLGIGYGDDNIDNERFGMRKFLYYNIGGGQNGDPETALEHYNYLIGIWRNGLPMTYGGDGFQTGNDPNQLADFMFGDDTDVVGFGTDGDIREPWTEVTADNNPGDRRFIQSAGPFSLAPGDYNNITVGVVYGRALSGNQFESVEVLKQADDKAQALFDNCFEIVAGPDAPDVTIQELDEEIILYLTNNNSISTNYLEEFGANGDGFDASIPEFNSAGEFLDEEARTYKFQGYQVYQLANNEVTINELNDLTSARLIKTLDIQDGIESLVNWTFDSEIGEVVPSLEASGTDSGIEHSLSIVTDAFATGTGALVNYKTYYFLVLAYGYNNYEDYNPSLGTGQATVYKSSRKAAASAVRVQKAIPHPTESEANGTSLSAGYGDGISLTRIEGMGNSTNTLDFASSTEQQIMSGAPWKVQQTTYAPDGGPISVKVIDPLALKDASFSLKLAVENEDIDTAKWVLTELISGTEYTSTNTIEVLNEELLLDFGLSITWTQYVNPFPDVNNFREPLEATLEYADSNSPWLSGIPDGEGFFDLNWIRSGISVQDGLEPDPDLVQYDDYIAIDPEEQYEGLLNGTVAPYTLTSYSAFAEASGVLINVAPNIESLKGSSLTIGNRNNLTDINNVDIVMTSDKTLWSRCPVLEMQWNPGLVQTSDALASYNSDGSKMRTRRHPSVDKNGLYSGQSGFNSAEGSLNGQQPEGMGWFPGYAIDLDTGERLNMAFGEDSWLGSENGRDMIWNPTSTLFDNGGLLGGGQHWVYIFKNTINSQTDEDLMPGYDAGNFLYQNLVLDDNLRDVYRSCTWVYGPRLNQGFDLLSAEDGLIPSDARIRLRVAKEYGKFSPADADIDDDTAQEAAQNHFNPMYTFDTSSIASRSEDGETLESVLDDIGIVPNPYYAYSDYEETKLDNIVKIINLPYDCDISIYNLSGTLIRQYQKADPVTFLDWDLKNQVNIPIASGIYLIHIKTDQGDRIIKWFGVMRPVDLDNF
jgi:hypothetical protein